MPADGPPSISHPRQVTDEQCDMCGAMAMVSVSGAGFGRMVVCIDHADNAFAVAGSAIRSLVAAWERTGDDA